MIGAILPTVGDVVALAVWLLFFGTIGVVYVAERRRDRRRDAWDALARRDAARRAQQCRHLQRGRR